ncbi:MAG TPA: transcription antitermination factor NusB, partial [Terriglobales bacterium]|nr:transcription antitermination factor NusB [Terriglobales bacterium]
RLEKLDTEVLVAIRMGVYQLRHLERIPARAAINESVELVKHAGKRSAAPFVNAVLRKIASFLPENERPIERIRSARSSEVLTQWSAHPQWLVDRWIARFGFKAAQGICAHDQTIPQTAIRLRDATIEKELLRDDIALAPGNLVADARQVLSGDVIRTKGFAEGRIVIQDEASQLVALLVGKGQHIMDCCAAPGGKTRILSDRNPKSSVVALELHPGRARLLRKLVSAKNVHVLASDMRRTSVAAHFDRVLADVPCSGTGTLARHPEIKWRLRQEDLPRLQSYQLEILQSAMSRVAQGGRLVYSTCSLEEEENSQVVQRALASDASFRLLDCRSELEDLKRHGHLVLSEIDSVLQGKYLQILPSELASDGFFAAILEKQSG